jgi:hypothetical protein
MFLGGRCAKCGNNDLRVLQIDHVNGDGRQEYLTLGGSYRIAGRVLEHPTDYQALCANCNWIKRWERHETKPLVPDEVSDNVEQRYSGKNPVEQYHFRTHYLKGHLLAVSGLILANGTRVCGLCYRRYHREYHAKTRRDKPELIRRQNWNRHLRYYALREDRVG